MGQLTYSTRNQTRKTWTVINISFLSTTLHWGKVSDKGSFRSFWGGNHDTQESPTMFPNLFPIIFSHPRLLFLCELNQSIMRCSLGFFFIYSSQNIIKNLNIRDKVKFCCRQSVLFNFFFTRWAELTNLDSQYICIFIHKMILNSSFHKAFGIWKVLTTGETASSELMGLFLLGDRIPHSAFWVLL